MTNKEQINNLKDYTDSYFNFVYTEGQKALGFKISKTRFFKDKSELEKLDYFKALHDEYNGYLVIDDSFFYAKLNGDLENYKLEIFLKDMRLNFISPTLQVALALLCLIKRQRKLRGVNKC
ncbi:TPA: hypothetical protein RZK14_001722 [Campylobacter coli]|nr:hypothetical protein [Campylobacter coli]